MDSKISFIFSVLICAGCAAAPKPSRAPNYTSPDAKVEVTPAPKIEVSPAVAEFFTKFNAIYVDPDAVRLTEELRRVIAPDGDADLRRLNGLEILMARAQGLSEGTAEFRNWQVARDTFQAQIAPEVKYRRLARLLGEPTKVLMNEDRIYLNFNEAMLRAAQPEPAMLIKLIRALGVGPKLARLITQETLLKNAATPFVKPPVPEGGRIAPNYVDLNRAIYRNFIEGCLYNYTQGTRTTEQLQRGACGVRSPEGLGY